MPDNPRDDIPGKLSNIKETSSDQQIAELQKKLEHEKDARCEERFVFIVVVVILLDVFFFSFMPTFGGPIAILVLELIFLAILAQRMGMEQLAIIFYNVVSRIAGNLKQGED